MLTQDLRWQVSTSAPLLALGAIVAETVSWTPWSLPVLLVPVAALYRSASLAMRREQEALRDGLTGLANRTMLTTATDARHRVGDGPVGRAADRPRPLQGDQRHPRPRRRRRAAGRRRAPAVVERARRTTWWPGSAATSSPCSPARIDGPRGRRASWPSASARGCARPSRPAASASTCTAASASRSRPEHSDTVEGLLRCADVALYSAKVTRGHATRSTTRSATPTRSPASGCRRICGGPSRTRTTARSPSPTSRSST